MVAGRNSNVSVPVASHSGDFSFFVPGCSFAVFR